MGNYQSVKCVRPKKLTGLFEKDMYMCQHQLKCCFLMGLAQIWHANVPTCLAYLLNFTSLSLIAFKKMHFFVT